ncbi:DM13 domain-containing protein [Streptomyces ferrugineus]|uniref:DM13 domain-containing protein n=1 Tax=Streptomyces ferrugineus TaxID=1413221 RepID=A0A7M2SKW8_9ACTN|nr:DM13 domain-containing protein [Streptomyces ferrugineus]QOV36914.1 DM13 domain-containing protein [Streptomyces ferrugineus]
MGRARRSRVRPWMVAVLTVVVVGAGFGLYWFQPWKLWQDTTVQEALPGTVVNPTPSAETPSAETPSDEAPSDEAPSGASSPSAPEAPAGPTTLASGELISHEHTTSGSVKLVRLPDGGHVVRLENLDTSNGPDLRVWLTDAPVKEGRAGWGVFDDGKYVSLGKLKGNKGSQNYTVPADVDLARYSSISIWCDRFNVSFGAAELARA